MTSSKKQNSKAKRGGRRSRRSFAAFTGPFPPSRSAVMRYVEPAALVEGAAGTGQFLVMSPTSLFDPNNSGVGHQPMYYDQLCSATGPYTKYRTFHTNIRVTFANNGTSPAMVGMFVSPNGSTPASNYAAIEKPWSTWTWVGQNTGGDSVRTLSLSVPHSKALGVSMAHLRNDDYYSGAYNSSPSINYFIVIFVYGSTSVATIYTTVELDTQSEFFSLTNTGTS